MSTLVSRLHINFPSSQSTDIGSGAKFKVVETGYFDFNRSRFDIGLFKITDELVSQTKSIVKLTVEISHDILPVIT